MTAAVIAGCKSDAPEATTTTTGNVDCKTAIQTYLDTADMK